MSTVYSDEYIAEYQSTYGKVLEEHWFSAKHTIGQSRPQEEQYGHGEPMPTMPGSTGGVVETVKRSVVAALRTALTGTSLSLPNGSEVHVDLEYPMKAEHYPSVWVQFSVRKMQTSGIGHEWTQKNGDVVRQWMYDGDVALTLVALTSIERDRIADALMSYFAFSRPGTKEQSLSPLYQELADNPYVSMTINSDQLTPGGQSVTIGVPWDPDRLAYEDNYRFQLHGEFQSVWTPSTDVTRLRAIRVIADVEYHQILPGEWV